MLLRPSLHVRHLHKTARSTWALSLARYAHSQSQQSPKPQQRSWKAPDDTSRTVAILGGGVLGRRIASSWVAADYETVLCDLNEQQRNAAAEYIEHTREEYA